MTRTTFIIFACNVILWLCVAQLNHYLATLHFSVFAGGLLVAFPALRLRFREGWWASLLIGLLIDASAPVAFGFHGLLFVVMHVFIFNLRGRFPLEETTFGVITALLANLALFIVITASLLHRSPEPFAMLPRLFIDLLASQTLVFLVAPWFFALQENTLERFGVSLRREQRGLLS